MLFCTLALGPLVFPYLLVLLGTATPPGIVGLAIIQLAMEAGVCLSLYALIGAAAGGAIGLGTDLWARRHSARTMNPDPRT